MSKEKFFRQRILESSCARKVTGEIDILIKSTNDDRRIMQNMRITIGPPTKVIAIENNSAGYILTKSQEFKRTSE